MRKLTLTAHQFNNFVYPNVATNTAKGDGNWECALRVMTILNNPEFTKEIPKTAAETKAEAEGRATYQLRHLLDESAEFLLQDDEHRMIRDKVKGARDDIALMAAADFEATLQAINDAEKTEVEEKKDAPAEETED